MIHFIDNVGAYSGLGKGYSRDVDSGRMISVFHTMNVALGANVWFEYVPSKARRRSQFKAVPRLRPRPPIAGRTYVLFIVHTVIAYVYLVHVGLNIVQLCTINSTYGNYIWP